jgi:hypothetical protein
MARFSNQKDYLAAHWSWHISLLIACLIPSFVVGLLGLLRPYDAIPDQDLLWASEALRLIRGVAPSYADHPGVFWTLVYRFNIEALQAFASSPVLDSMGSITPADLAQVIKAARIQNAFICGICAYLLFPVSQLLGTHRLIATSLALICSLSPATLIGVSEIRHETISAVFLLLTIAIFNKALQQKRKATRRLLTISAIALFFCAAFSKNQSLLLTPLVWLAIAAIAWKQSDTRQSVQHLSRQFGAQGILVFAIASCLPWLISAYPDIDLINLPFWVVINSGLACILLIGWNNREDKRMIYKAFAGLGAAEIILFRALSPQWWRQGVTGFPSWMFRYANAAENENINIANHIQQGVDQYFGNLFTPQVAAQAAFFTLTITSLIVMAYFVVRRSVASMTLLAQVCAWSGCTFILLSCSQRIASRYEIYIFIPIMISAGISLRTIKPVVSTGNMRTALSRTLPICAAVLISTAAIRSGSNIPNLRRFVNQGQSREVLCIGHHMDRTMRLTSAGQCEVFPKGSFDKNIYDSWWGPRG